MGIDLSLADYLLVSLSVAFGAFAQGMVGFGANLLAAPLLAVVAPAALPGTMILVPLPMQAMMVRHEVRGVDWRDVGWTVAGQLPGIALGAWIVTAVARDRLSLLTGTFVMVGVAVSLLATAVPFTRSTKLTAGFASGVMGTATSIGGPPLALLYQHHDGKVLRPTLAVCFMISTGVALPVLTLAGVMEWWHLRLAATLLPPLFAGLWLSRQANRYVDGPRLRPFVLGLAAVAALLAMARGVGLIG